MDKNYCIIMAGGVGSRFWPLSTIEQPKQFIDILGVGRTMLQLTYDRFKSIIPDRNFLVVTSKEYKNIVLSQLPELNEDQILLETVRRNTAPCIAYASYKIWAKTKNANIVVTPSDHYINNTEAFLLTITEGLDFISKQNSLLTLGITPTYPATGYGYIEYEKSQKAIYNLKSFKEKPDEKTAIQYLQKDSYFWNSGIFLWNIKTILESFNLYLPEIAKAFDIQNVYWKKDEQSIIDKVYASVKSISIDYGIMEKSDNIHVLPAKFDWNDLGTWSSLYNQLEKDSNSNVISGENISTVNTNSTLIKSVVNNKRIIVNGLNNYLVVDTDDALIITPKDDEDELNTLIKSEI